ncbi:nucleoside hydrolase [Hymenobacter sp. HMF4947]|uniref:Nucleoside hydrolase n=1 Tax=Hymenobacter ginkgonis TaxID=2682976 RepID=A0A7K1TEP3_9BACT|nr:nucleoside hydrolase [Hymenobacter ginkgonis]MVN76601.1 nucleoside hydrolase [Hymenobacter ginkgonis]
MTNRFRLVCLLVGLLAWSGQVLAQRPGAPPLIAPRLRVIVDNDFSGDPDGLFQLAHLLLSPSVEIRAIIGSHLRVGDGFDSSTHQADNAAKKAAELLQVMQLAGRVPILAGSNVAMSTDSTPVRNDAVNFIIQEALRTDTQLPLFVLCGAGLTEVVSAALTEPRIADKLTLVWIGGPEYPDLALPPPHYTNPEYNSNIDLAAARALFNRTRLPLWQVPRNAYRQVLLPYSVLVTQVKPRGQVGRYLSSTIENLMARLPQYHLNIGETYILGDSPLVLLTALQSSFEADPSSSEYIIRQAPRLTEQGTYAFASTGRPIRIYTRLDTPLLFNDFFAKLMLFTTKK